MIKSLNRIILTFVSTFLFGLMFAQSINRTSILENSGFPNDTKWYYFKTDYYDIANVEDSKVHSGSYSEYYYLHPENLWTYVKKENTYYIYNRLMGPSFSLSLNKERVRREDIMSLLIYSIPIINVITPYILTKTKYNFVGSIFDEKNKGISQKVFEKQILPSLSYVSTEKDIKQILIVLEKSKKSLGVLFSNIDDKGKIDQNKVVWYNLISFPEGETKSLYVSGRTDQKKAIQKDPMFYHVDPNFLWAFIKTPMGVSLYNKGKNSICFENLLPIKQDNKFIFENYNGSKLECNKFGNLFLVHSQSSKFEIELVGDEKTIDRKNKALDQKLASDSLRIITELNLKVKNSLDSLGSIYGHYLEELAQLNLVKGMPIDLLKEKGRICKTLCLAPNGKEPI